MADLRSTIAAIAATPEVLRAVIEIELAGDRRRAPGDGPAGARRGASPRVPRMGYLPTGAGGGPR